MNENYQYRSSAKCTSCGLSDIFYKRNDKCAACQASLIPALNAINHGENVRHEGDKCVVDITYIYDEGRSQTTIPHRFPASSLDDLHELHIAMGMHGLKMARTPCRRCGFPRLHRADKPRECFACKVNFDGATLSPRQEAKAAGRNRYVPEEPCSKCGQRAERAVNYHRCYGCNPDKQDSTSHPRKEARDAGRTRYVPNKPCRHCGQRAERAVNYHRCYGCHPERPVDVTTSPRQRAIAAGETWYTPDTACRRCGQHALRRVHDGRCQGCHPLKRATPLTDTDREIMRTCPGMTMTREQAKGLGLNVYCEGGEWLRVDTGNPVEER